MRIRSECLGEEVECKQGLENGAMMKKTWDKTKGVLDMAAMQRQKYVCGYRRGR